MSLFINPFQLFERGVGIDLRRADALMTQQILDTLQPSTVVQHGCGEGVTEHMGRLFFQRGDGRQVFPHNLLHLFPRNPQALVAQEQRFVPISELRITHRHIAMQFCCQFLSEGDNTLLVPLARHFQLTRCEIDILIVQPYQFRASQASLIE